MRLARRAGAPGVFGRFGLATVVGLLAVYLPYWYQGARYLLPAAAVLDVAAATILAPAVARAARLVRAWRLARAHEAATSSAA